MLIHALPHTILTLYSWYNIPPEETDSESDVEGEQDIENIEETAPDAVERVVQEDNIQPPTQWTAPTDVTSANHAAQVAPVQAVDISSLASLLPATTSGIPIRDYAFQKAKEASYALGYWTAVYELQSQKVRRVPVEPDVRFLMPS